MINIHRILLANYPNAKDTDWLLQDDSDGRGPYIREWYRPEPKPTKAQLEAMAAAYKPPEPSKAERLAASDAGMIRVYEDVIDVLEAKGILRLEDLPVSAQAKLAARRYLRK